MLMVVANSVAKRILQKYANICDGLEFYEFFNKIKF